MIMVDLIILQAMAPNNHENLLMIQTIYRWRPPGGGVYSP